MKRRSELPYKWNDHSVPICTGSDQEHILTIKDSRGYAIDAVRTQHLYQIFYIVTFLNTFVKISMMPPFLSPLLGIGRHRSSCQLS